MSLPGNFMILAAGRGERLRPMTDVTPKPLIDINGDSMIARHLTALHAMGCEKVVVNISHLGERIKSEIGNIWLSSMKIDYSEEYPDALETAGGIRRALPLFSPGPVLVINGDIVCDFDFSTLSLEPDKTMHLIMVPNPSHHPDGDFAFASPTENVNESPDCGPLSLNPDLKKLTYSGIGLFRQELFEKLADGKAPLAPLIRQQIVAGNVSGTVFRGLWVDVGKPERLETARFVACIEN